MVRHGPPRRLTLMKLVFHGADFDGQVCNLREPSTNVGRGSDNALVIQDSSVSVHHCEILVHGTEVIVRDCDSANGTWVDGVRVTAQQAVRNGQTIRFGSVAARLVFPAQPVDEPSEITAVHLHASAVRQARQKPSAVPARTVIRPHSMADDVDKTMAIPGVTQHAKPIPESFVPEPRRTGSTGRALVYVILALVAVGLVWFVWRMR